MSKKIDENNDSTLIRTSLRNVIENCKTDLILPYKILCQFHLSSWNSFENHLEQILNRNSIIDQEFILLHRFNFEEQQQQQSEIVLNFDKDFELLINCKF